MNKKNNQKFVVPSIGMPLKLRDVLLSLFPKGDKKTFQKLMQVFSNNQYCLFVNSGTTALFLILKALQQLKSATEIILPAYTAPSLVLPIKKAGLRPILCDISLDTFNMDINTINSVVSSNTLAILVVHMFGIPTNISQIKTILNDQNIFIIDDAASAMGSKINGNVTGSMGDVGLYSFNRGKNFTTSCGGCLLSNRTDLIPIIEAEIAKLPDMTFLKNMDIVLKTTALSLIMNPFFYKQLKPFINKFKYHDLHTAFNSYQYSFFQKRLGVKLFHRLQFIISQRIRNGEYLRKRFNNLNHILLPNVAENSTVVYNQFPIQFKEIKHRNRVYQKLNEIGIEVTTLYPVPIHRIQHPQYELGYEQKPDPFPNATYFAKRLLLIPTHPFVKIAHLDKVIGTIKNITQITPIGFAKSKKVHKSVTIANVQ